MKNCRKGGLFKDEPKLLKNVIKAFICQRFSDALTAQRWAKTCIRKTTPEWWRLSWLDLSCYIIFTPPIISDSFWYLHSQQQNSSTDLQIWIQRVAEVPIMSMLDTICSDMVFPLKVSLSTETFNSPVSLCCKTAPWRHAQHSQKGMCACRKVQSTGREQHGNSPSYP